MDSREISLILTHEPYARNYFLGCFSRDNIPFMGVNSQWSFVLNTDVSTGSGKHWIGVYVQRDTVYFYDSLANTKWSAEVNQWFHHFRLVYYNKNRHQSKTTSTCGGFAIYFISQMSRGEQFATFLNKMDMNEPLSDTFIANYLRTRHNFKRHLL